MTLVFDTSVLIEIERHNKQVMEETWNLVERYGGAPYITSPTYSEYYYGFLKKYPSKKNGALADLDNYLLLNTTRGSSKLFAELKHAFESVGKTFPAFDLLIASIVMDHRMTLVTADKRFEDVPGLKTELLSNGA